MNLGDLLIKFSAVCAAVGFVSAIRWWRDRPGAERMFRWAYQGMTATLLMASALLMVAILRHDFRFDYVIGYSSRDLPLLYLVSAFWAGQQGTYLLWGLVGALLGLTLIRKSAWEPAKVMTFYLPTVAFMHVLMLDPSGNPFKLALQIPADGRGLNPLLQDPWMASHPPLIFLGYAAAAIPAALAMVALVSRREDRWLPTALRWSLVSFVLLGAGIVLGGFWAYKVLGWGGYWGWDPVENASLVPWLLLAALVHGLLVQKATGSLARTNLVLGLACYATVFYATFLTRSGVLADFSVHSFPAGTIYRLLLGIQLLIVGASIVALIRRGSIPGREIPIQLAWPLKLTAVIILLAVSATFVLIGTSWPIITSMLGRPSALGIPWYNTVNQPIYIAMFAILGVAPLLAWKVRPWRLMAGRLGIVVATAATATVAATVFGARGGVALALFFVGTAALAANVIRLVEVSRTRWLNSGAALAHVGFALMILGIVGSSFWGVAQDARLPRDQPVEVLGRTLTFVGHVDGSEPRDRWRVEVREAGGVPYFVDATMFRTGPGPEDQIMRNPAIVRRWGGDLYIAPAAFEPSTGHLDLEMAKGQPYRMGDSIVTFLEFKAGDMDGHGMTVWARVAVESEGAREVLELPYSMVQGQQAESPPVPSSVGTALSTLSLNGMSVENKTIFVHADTKTQAPEVFSVNVSTKPVIGMLWVGTFLLGIGCCVAWSRRCVEAREQSRVPVAPEGARPQQAKEKHERPAGHPAHARNA